MAPSPPPKVSLLKVANALVERGLAEDQTRNPLGGFLLLGVDSVTIGVDCESGRRVP